MGDYGDDDDPDLDELCEENSDLEEDEYTECRKTLQGLFGVSWIGDACARPVSTSPKRFPNASRLYTRH